MKPETENPKRRAFSYFTLETSKLETPLHLSSFNLNQFRCFESLRLEMKPGITIFHGDNAQGKTSILEAMCVLLRLQSPRSSALADCILFEKNAFAIGGNLVTDAGDESDMRMQYSSGGRTLLIDDEMQKRSADYLNHSALVVWMANDDLALVRAGGDGRRRYLDFMASQLFPTYRPALRAYDKAMRSRNFLLKRDASPKWPEIDAYTKILADQALIVTRIRRELLTKLTPFAEQAQRTISGRDEKLGIEYLSKSGENDDLAAELLSRRSEEYGRRITVAGPHRDDFTMVINGRPAAKFASEGQQRTLALALKLAQTELFLSLREQPPILLIDDVFGELDVTRRNALMNAWPKTSQKLITTTNLDWLDGDFSGAARVEICDGIATIA
ncbi:DNA replication and repair protein RecF [bacterium]|nr:DNA replication and repair protein RecF [bacterium]